jgi:integral membrane protein
MSRVDENAETKVGEALPSLAPAEQLRRKIRITKLMAIIEAISYSMLLVFMFRKYILDDHSKINYAWLRVTAYFHGMICIAFAVMIFDIFRAMRWTKFFALLTLVGPPGALLAHWRLSRQPFPENVTKADMFFR